jgi:hypothetical protein
MGDLESSCQHGQHGAGPRRREVATHVTGFEPQASADGSVIYFCHQTETDRVTDVSRIDGRNSVATPDFCISPDERRLLYGQIDFANTNIMRVDQFR